MWTTVWSCVSTMQAKEQISEGEWNSLQYELEVARKTRLQLEKKLSEIEKQEEASK